MLPIPILSVAGINAETYKRDFAKEVMRMVMFDSNYPCHLEILPDPTNKYDPNALKVQLNSRDIGFVSKNDQKYIDVTKEYIAKIESWGVMKDQSVYLYFQAFPKD